MIPVVAAVILRGDLVLVTRRPRGGHMAGKWEFPGGKIEEGEKPAEALRREIREELGCRVRVGRRILRVCYRYPGKSVRLDFFSCRVVSGEPHGREGQRVRWVRRSGLGRLDFPPADQRILSMLAGAATPASRRRPAP